MTDGDAFLRQIEADPSPSNKLVYADWLEEQGEDDLAFAYRWAGKRDRHPYRSPAGRHWSWSVKLRGQNKAVYSWQIPTVVFNNLRPTGNFAGQAPNRRFHCKNLRMAFVRLAAALAKIRMEIE